MKTNSFEEKNGEEFFSSLEIKEFLTEVQPVADFEINGKLFVLTSEYRILVIVNESDNRWEIFEYTGDLDFELPDGERNQHLNHDFIKGCLTMVTVAMS